jgi:hypothetical protein
MVNEFDYRVDYFVEHSGIASSYEYKYVLKDSRHPVWILGRFFRRK